MSDDNAHLPFYAQNMPQGPTPRGIQVPHNPHGMAKGLAKIGNISKPHMPRRSLLRRIGLKKTWKKRFF